MTTYVGDRIYAYKDPEATGTTLYAWTVGESSEDMTISTVYTTDAIPTSSSVFYDKEGNVLDITTIRNALYHVGSFYSGTSEECVFTWEGNQQQI